MQTLTNPSSIPVSRKTIYIHGLEKAQLSFPATFDLTVWALTAVQSCQDLNQVSVSEESYSLVTYPWLCWMKINAFDPLGPREQLLL